MEKSMNDVWRQLYDTVKARQTQPVENSYTCYLFEQGLDKILKKVGEEAAEVIIAAKNGYDVSLTGELADLIYHLTVLMVECELPPEALTDELARRADKIGNKKTETKSDHNT